MTLGVTDRIVLLRLYQNLNNFPIALLLRHLYDVLYFSTWTMLLICGCLCQAEPVYLTEDG